VIKLLYSLPHSQPLLDQYDVKRRFTLECGIVGDETIGSD
jgi:hypothetical protein